MTDRATDEANLKALGQVLNGKPIDEVAPLLITAVARMLVTDADGDADRLGFLVHKFTTYLGHVINDMTGATLFRVTLNDEPLDEDGETLH